MSPYTKQQLINLDILTKRLNYDILVEDGIEGYKVRWDLRFLRETQIQDGAIVHVLEHITSGFSPTISMAWDDAIEHIPDDKIRFPIMSACFNLSKDPLPDKEPERWEITIS